MTAGPLLTAALLLSACGVFDSDLLKACEAAMQDRLRSPSTYERIAASEGEEIITADAYLEATAYPGRSTTSARIDRESIESGRSKARRLYAIVTYEAKNAYGTPIRNRFNCEYVTTQESPSIYATLVSVDGETNSERLIRELQEAQRSGR